MFLCVRVRVRVCGKTWSILCVATNYQGLSLQKTKNKLYLRVGMETCHIIIIIVLIIILAFALDSFPREVVTN